MAKSVMISIQPQWVKKILNGEKTIEIRKKSPKLQTPFKCYIYCTLTGNRGERYLLTYAQYCGFDIDIYNRDFIANGKVVAEFVCDRIIPINVFNNGTIQNWNCNELKESCVPYERIVTYIGANRSGFGWHISNLKVYDNPKELCEFTKYSEVDNRPCENGGDCQYAYYDYSEDCSACGIDFDGEACPFIKMQRPPQSWCYVDGWGGFDKMSFATKCRVDEIDNCIAEIVNATTVDAVEVVHGEWSIIEDDYLGLTALECSECKQEYWFEEEPPLKIYSYCPNCGEKMDGDGNG